MALWLLTAVWCLLLLAAALGARVGSGAALLLSYTACAALVLSTRPRPRPSVSLLGVGLAAAAGFVALPAWLASIWMVGVLLAFPAVPRASSAAASASAWLAHVALAPLFEELLYRERLLPALRERIGAPLALALSSALFAAPHLEPWTVLTTFCVGLVLGGVFLSTGRVDLCVAYHAGLNAAVLVCGLPPARAALSTPVAALVSSVLLGLACGWTGRRAARSRVHTAARGSHLPSRRRA